MAVMIWCEHCKTVVWAYDHQNNYDIRGLVNEFGLKCPRCGDSHCFDGWGSDKTVEELSEKLSCFTSEPVYDKWSAMKVIAEMHHLIWNPSGDNTWK